MDINFTSLERATNEAGLPWEVHDSIIEIIGKIKFECSFVNNVCKHYREQEYYARHAMTCCCKDCGKYRGYINAIRVGDSSYYSKLYDIETGFYRRNYGCLLTLERRSTYCACYYCKTIECTLTSQQIFILDMMIALVLQQSLSPT